MRCFDSTPVFTGRHWLIHFTNIGFDTVHCLKYISYTRRFSYWLSFLPHRTTVIDSLSTVWSIFRIPDVSAVGSTSVFTGWQWLTHYTYVMFDTVQCLKYISYTRRFGCWLYFRVHLNNARHNTGINNRLLTQNTLHTGSKVPNSKVQITTSDKDKHVASRIFTF